MATKSDKSALINQGRDESSPEDIQPSEKFGIEDLKKVAAETQGIDAFDAFQGESLGLNILDLEIGESDGPFTVTSIVPTEFGKGKVKNKINVYTAVKGTTEVRMPISASFVSKADEYPFKIGTVFAVKRVNNYQTKEHGIACKGYLIKVKV
jgi:hypothetical protein